MPSQDGDLKIDVMTITAGRKTTGRKTTGRKAHMSSLRIDEDMKAQPTVLRATGEPMQLRLRLGIAAMEMRCLAAKATGLPAPISRNIGHHTLKRIFLFGILSKQPSSS